MSAADAGAALRDALLAAGFGTALCFCRGFLMELFRVRRRAAAFVFELLFFAFWGFLAFLFILGKTACREPRGFLLAGCAAGAGAYALCFRGIAHRLARLLRRGISLALRPFFFLAGFMGKPLGALLKAGRRFVYNKRRGKTNIPTEQQTDAGQPPPRRAYTQA